MASSPTKVRFRLDRFYNAILAEDEVALRAKLENAIREGADYDIGLGFAVPTRLRYLPGHRTSQSILKKIGVYVGITRDLTERSVPEEERESWGSRGRFAHINRVNMRENSQTAFCGM